MIYIAVVETMGIQTMVFVVKNALQTYELDIWDIPRGGRRKCFVNPFRGVNEIRKEFNKSLAAKRKGSSVSPSYSFEMFLSFSARFVKGVK